MALALTSCALMRHTTVTRTGMNQFKYGSGEYLNYEVRGRGKTVVVFLHGFAASLRNWDDVIHNIPEEEITAYIIDLKGSGLSSKPHDGRYSIQDNAALIFDFIKEHGLRDYVIVGHSYGGGVALFVALQSMKENINRPNKLVLIDAAAYRTELPFFVSYLRIPIFGSALLYLTSPEFKAKYVLRRIVFDEKNITDQLVDRYAASQRNNGAYYALQQTAAQVIPSNFKEYTEQYKNLNCDTLIVWGENDLAIPLSSGERLARDIPQSRLVVLPRCGHNPHEEYPQETARLIREFAGR